MGEVCPAVFSFTLPPRQSATINRLKYLERRKPFGYASALFQFDSRVAEVASVWTREGASWFVLEVILMSLRASSTVAIEQTMRHSSLMLAVS